MKRIWRDGFGFRSNPKSTYKSSLAALVFEKIVSQSIRATKLLLVVMAIASVHVHAQKSLPASAAPVPLLSAQVQIFYNFYEKTEGGSAFTQEEQEQMGKALNKILKNKTGELPPPIFRALVQIKEDMVLIPQKSAFLVHDNRGLSEILKFHHITAASILQGGNFIDVGSQLFNAITRGKLLRLYAFFFHSLFQDFLASELAIEDEEFFEQRRKDLLNLIDFERDLIKELEVLAQQVLEKLYSRDELKGEHDLFRQEYGEIIAAIASFKEEQVRREKAIKKMKWKKWEKW